VRPKTRGLPFEFYRWVLAEKFGWSLEYIDSLSMADLHEYFHVQDGRQKASTSMLVKNE
jgi:hypothetical protein